MDIKMDELKIKLADRESLPVDIRKKYAVCVPLIFDEATASWNVVYEKRSSDLRRQPSEVSFPGGRLEEGEHFLEAAIRETMEELLIERDNIEVVGELDYIVMTGSSLIKSFLVVLKGIKLEDIKPSKYEVDHVFSVPLSFFLENEPLVSQLDMKTELKDGFPYDLIPNGKDYKFAVGRNVVLFYQYKDYIIWGFTAKMTNSFIEILKS